LWTLAGILPDVDGLGGRLGCSRLNDFRQGEHISLLPAVSPLRAARLAWSDVATVVLVSFARQRWRVALLCMLAFHLHLFCDLLGSRGPTVGDLWPIAYSEPIFRNPVFFWKGQWRLDGWQNRVVCLTLFATEFFLAARRGYSCVQVFSQRADAVFVSVLQKWRNSFSRRFSGDHLQKQ